MDRTQLKQLLLITGGRGLPVPPPERTRVRGLGWLSRELTHTLTDAVRTQG